MKLKSAYKSRKKEHFRDTNQAKNCQDEKESMTNNWYWNETTRGCF